jgi:Methyltransferase domain
MSSASGIRYLTALDSHMTLGERAAIEGILRTLEPRLAVEIGTAEGGSLRQIAAHAEEVHSFDLAAPEQPPPGNARFHIGDSHRLLPEALAGFAGAGRNVDLALVDGDHTAAGVRRDVQDLLASPAVGQCVVLLHDTANETVREGLAAVPYGDWPKVTWVDLDFLPGYLFREPERALEAWGGLGIVLVDDRAPRPDSPLTNDGVFPASEVLAAYRERLAGGRSRGRRRLRDLLSAATPPRPPFRRRSAPLR